MAEAAEMVFGGRAFRVRPLTLGQIKDVLPQLVTAGRGVVDPGFLDACVDIIATGLRRDYAEITRERIMDTETTVPELAAALAVIVALSGLVPSGEAAAGSGSMP